MTWQQDGDNPRIEHLDGVKHSDAPRPRRWHRCRAQSRGYLGEGFTYVERCACGALKIGRFGAWGERNSRGRNS